MNEIVSSVIAFAIGGIAYIALIVILKNKRKRRTTAEIIEEMWVKMNKQDQGGTEMSEVIYKKCPKCGATMVRDDKVVYTSLPPQYRYVCPKCGASEVDTYPPRGFIQSEIPVSGSIRDWDTPLGPSISKDIPTESGTQKDLHPNFQDRKFLTEEEFKNLIAANEGFTWDEYRREVAKDTLRSMVAAYTIDSANIFPDPEEVCGMAVMYADELIKQLKKGSK